MANSTTSERLNILYLSQMPASPPRFGAQARIHGLITELTRRHDLTAVMLVDDEFDITECRFAMQAYAKSLRPSRPNANDCCSSGRWSRPEASSDCELHCQRCNMLFTERCVPAGSTSSTWSLRSSATAICVKSRPSERPPALIVDSHKIDYDLARQYARIRKRAARSSAARRGHLCLHWLAPGSSSPASCLTCARIWRKLRPWWCP